LFFFLIYISNYFTKKILNNMKAKLPTPEEEERDDVWFRTHINKLSKTHPGEHVAVLDQKPVAYGRDFGEAYDLAKEKFPGKVPLVAYIPKEGDELILI